MTDSRDLHAWVEEHALAYDLDLLSDEERERFDRHLAACGECRARVEAMRPDPELRPHLSPGHIPVEVISRWDRARDSLPEPQRTWVREHLDRCAECREDLAFVGFPDPYGARVIQLPDVAAAVRTHGLDRYKWLAAGWGAGALTTAAAVILILNSKAMIEAQREAGRAALGDSVVATAPPAPGGESPMAPEIEPGPGTERAQIVVLDRPMTVTTLSAPERSAGAPEAEAGPTVRVSAAVGLIQLRVDPLPLVEGDVPVTIEVTGPDGKTILRERRRHEDFFHDRVVALTIPREALRPGVYHFHLRTDATGDSLALPTDARYPFRVRVIGN